MTNPHYNRDSLCLKLLAILNACIFFLKFRCGHAYVLLVNDKIDMNKIDKKNIELIVQRKSTTKIEFSRM